MPIIHCPGHEFRPMTWALDRTNVPGQHVCKHCGLKVKTIAARDYFKGKVT
jgi:hypothetical protein